MAESVPQTLSLDALSLNSLGTHLLYGAIDEQSAYETSHWLLKSALIYNPDEILTMFINSPGGNVDDGNAIISLMESNPHQIQTVAIGCIASMGVSIFIAGTKGLRLMTKNCLVMTHQFTTGMFGKQHELIAGNRMVQILENQFIEHYTRNTTMSAKQVKDILLGPSDRWLEPKECLKYGLCDKIVDTYVDKSGQGTTDNVKPAAKKAAKKKTTKVSDTDGQ